MQEKKAAGKRGRRKESAAEPAAEAEAEAPPAPVQEAAAAAVVDEVVKPLWAKGLSPVWAPFGPPAPHRRYESAEEHRTYAGVIRPRPDGGGVEEVAAEDPDLAKFHEELQRCVEGTDAPKAAQLIEEMWKKKEPTPKSYKLAIAACDKAGDEVRAALLREDMREIGAFREATRFHMAPAVMWNRQVRRVGCGVRNTVEWPGKRWQDGEPLPVPERPGDCWLIPSQDPAAVQVARYQHHLRHLGWKVLTCHADVIERLRNKAVLMQWFQDNGLGEFTPASYSVPSKAKFPCIIKPAMGTYGRDTAVAYSAEEVLRTAFRNDIYAVESKIQHEIDYYSRYNKNGKDEEEENWSETMAKIDKAILEWCEEKQHEELGDKWVLQELVPGQYEFSTTLLVFQGEILDVAATRYQYGAEVYVWPRVELLKWEYVAVPKAHMDIFRKAVVGFSGILNFNYKLRKDGNICIFEANPRVGGDLAFDIPKPRVRAMLEKMDALFC